MNWFKQAYARGWRWGILAKWQSLWVGVYYSDKNQRWCINLVPCVTFWVTRPGGRTPCGPDFDTVPRLDIAVD